MQGRVFNIVRPGQHDDFSHPNAVVVEVGKDAYLCVAGFTPDKEKYQNSKDEEFKLGIWGPAFAVEIDHVKHLTPADPRLLLHVCGYVCQTAELMTAAQLKGHTEWGTLSTLAVCDIASGLLEREKTRAFLPPKAVTARKKLLGR